jgi:hypothetical protein
MTISRNWIFASKQSLNAFHINAYIAIYTVELMGPTYQLETRNQLRSAFCRAASTQ